MPWPEPTALPVSRAAPACRRRSLRTHGACWAAATGVQNLRPRRGQKQHRHPRPDGALPTGVSSKSEHEPGAIAPFTPTQNPSSGPPARTAAQWPEHGRGTDHSRDRADHRPGKRIHFATIRKPAPFWGKTRRELAGPDAGGPDADGGPCFSMMRAARYLIAACPAISRKFLPGEALHLWLGRDSICRSGALPRQTGWPVASAGMRRNKMDTPISASMRASGAPRQ